MRRIVAILSITYALTSCAASNGSDQPKPALKPFDAPLVDQDLSKLPVPKEVQYSYDGLNELTINAPKAVYVLKVVPAPPIPADLKPAAAGIEIRKIATQTPTPDYAMFPETLETTDGVEVTLTVFNRFFEQDGRLAACGFFLRTPHTTTALKGAHWFVDMRSFFDIGGLARFPTEYIGSQGNNPLRGTMPVDAAINDPSIAKGIHPTCVVSNIAWDARFAAATSKLHLQSPPAKYEWGEKQPHLTRGVDGAPPVLSLVPR